MDEVYEELFHGRTGEDEFNAVIQALLFMEAQGLPNLDVSLTIQSIIEHPEWKTMQDIAKGTDRDFVLFCLRSFQTKCEENMQIGVLSAIYLIGQS